MLDSQQRERLLERIGLPPAGRRLVIDAAKYSPVRKVASKGGGNVITPYQSRKMQRTVETESRHLEFPAAVSLEHNPLVLEYFPQPCRLKFEVIDARHDETVKMLDANHREERREWQADAWRREEQLQQTITGLTDAVKEMNKRA